ncbi:SGNH/GDSL hydrolase family protein [Cytobacillus kochii]|uniref:SGNH/GDSL hydrolase family protein n=1 Tax=Cytobacillus kochii TaxID=859143 RepID=UPI00277F82BC|nr:SGNH/GDSL hydrolase family protein [Cytobacillus kochii]MDQ0184050.1 lysophospholipase L1-like esterase [Cytobacillus kochii]
MKRIFTLLLSIMVLLAGCNTNAMTSDNEAAEAKQMEDLTKQDIPAEFFPIDLNVVSIGDSLTQGVGDTTESGGYIPYLEKLLEEHRSINYTSFINYGVKGNRSNQLLERLNMDKVKNAVTESDLVIITIGGNDIMKVVRSNFTKLNVAAFEKEQDAFEDNLNTILHTIREYNPKSTVLLVGLYNPFLEWFSSIKELSLIMRQWNIASQQVLGEYENMYFVNVDDIFETSEENLLFTDHFHPNDRGYELMAGRIYQVLDQIGIKSVIENKEN